ncbi:MAG: hypothetical protein R8F63_18460 [Acidimicrobiales bacterium]|nr:hypothetical protein [Acidimicrobiales bacterium]
MSADDDLRRAFDAAAPPPPSPGPVRARLEPTMVRARRRRRVRVAVTGSVAGALALGGTALAVGQLIGDDAAEIGPQVTLPAPDVESPIPSDPPTTGAPSPSSPDAPPPTSSTPSTVTSPPPTTEMPPTTATPSEEVSGPHDTPCGSVTFVVAGTSVRIDSRTVVDGFSFTSEGDGTSEVHARWDDGPAPDCRVEAHLEDGELRVEVDDDDS